VRGLMLECGLTEAQISEALSPAMASFANTGTTIHPDDALVFSLSPETRTKFYRELGRHPGNLAMQYPYAFPGNTMEACFRDHCLDESIVTMIRKLMYSRGENQCFSDVSTVARNLPSLAEKTTLLRVLSRQPSVLARVKIGPDTDLDKLIAYWRRGLKVKDVRPLLESMKRMPGGSSVGLLFLLPQFARQRTYTFPSPSHPGEPAMDCHWSTINFFLETPDNRYSDSNEAVNFIKLHCSPVDAPSAYGDILIFLDAQSRAVHSAVYLAEDLVFTKNGNNFAQPWKLTRLSNLKAHYEMDGPVRMVTWRMNSDITLSAR
jgi:hypothetical protein